MKKSLFASSLVLIIAGFGATPLSTPISAQTPSVVAQSLNTSPAPPQVKLLSEGAEPRQILQFAPDVNSKQTLTMTMSMGMEMSFGGQTSHKFPIPATKVRIDTEVTKVDPNGDIHLRWTYADADVVASPAYPPQAIQAMRSELAKIVGLKGFVIIDRQGKTKEINFILPSESSTTTKRMYEQILNSLKQISSPFPIEAVGVGAKWEMSNQLTVSGMTLNQVTTYDIANIQDNVVTLNVSLEQHAGQQNFHPPGLPASASVKLKSLNSQGNGTFTLKLDQMMPIRGALSMLSRSEFNGRDNSSHQETTMAMKLSAEISLESK